MAAHHIFWTRSEEEFAADRELLTTLPGRVFLVPCLSFEPLPVPAIKGKPTQLIFTSSKAVALAKDNPILAKLMKKIPSVCFGQATQAELEALDIEVIAIEAHTAKEMADSLRLEEKYLYVGPESPAFDVAGYLHNRGAQCQHLAIYRTLHLVVESPEIKRLKPLVGYVCFASPSAVKAFCKAFDVSSLHAIAIGPTTASECYKHFPEVAVATEPAIAAMIERTREVIAAGKFAEAHP